MGSSKDFTTTVKYIVRDELYKTEKPYKCEFDPPDPSFPRSNLKFDHAGIKARNIEDRTSFSLDKHGFCLLKAPTSLSPEAALKDKLVIEDSYFQEIKALLHSQFPEYRRIELMNLVVSRRLNP